MLPKQIPLSIIVFGKERLRNVLNASRRRVNKNSLSWWYALKTSWRYLFKTSWRRLEDFLKTCLQDVSKTSWRRLEDVWPRRKYWSWPRRLEDVFWRRKAKANIFVLIKTSSRRLQDVFWRRIQKTSSRRLHQDKRLLGCKKRCSWTSFLKDHPLAASQHFAKFTGKQICESVYFVKFQQASMQLYYKRDSSTGAFLGLWNFKTLRSSSP